MLTGFVDAAVAAAGAAAGAGAGVAGVGGTTDRREDDEMLPLDR